MDTPTDRRPVVERGLRVLLFVAVTWTIAGSFLLLDRLGASLPQILSGSGLVADHWFMPSVEKTDCGSAIARLAPAGSGWDADTPLSVWQMGFPLGMAISARNAPAVGSSFDIPALMARAAQFAGRIGIAAPAMPGTEHEVMALTEFERFIERDPDCVAASLEFRYARRLADLYKFSLAAGADWFYRTFYPSLPPAYAVQIRHYGQRAGIPAGLTDPLLGDFSNATPGEAHAARIMALESAIETYIRTTDFHVPVEKP